MINGKKIFEMFFNGYKLVEKEYEYIDKLNIFPVPDGDTGTNMKMTLSGAFKDLEYDESIGRTASLFSRGLMYNARGNSGTIFSQIIRGISNPLKELKELDSISVVADCFRGAKEIAYRSVQSPQEGTILSVIRLVSEKIDSHLADFKDINDVFKSATSYAKEAVDDTPNMMQLLKEAGVVDSGGYALYLFIKGMSDSLEGKSASNKSTNSKKKIDNEIEDDFNPISNLSSEEHDDFGYCCEFILKLGNENLDNFTLDNLKNKINSKCNSIVTIQDEELVKVHAHTLEPGYLLNKCQSFGEFEKIKVENMSLQYLSAKSKSKHIEKAPENSKKIRKTTQIIEGLDEYAIEEGTAIICTVPSKSVGDYLVKDYWATSYIDQNILGNPSVQVFLDYIKESKKRNVIIITDNSNIIMAAETARKMIKNQIVEVIPSKTIIQTISCLLNYNPESSLKQIIRKMKYQTKKISTGFVSTSVRNVRYEDVIVKKGQKISLIDKKVIWSSNDIFDVLQKTIKYLLEQTRTKNEHIIQIFAGVSINESKRVELIADLSKMFHNCTFDVLQAEFGVYDFIIGVQ